MLAFVERKIEDLGNLGLTIWKIWPFWVTLALAATPLLFPWFRTEDRILRLGVAFQICGWLVVAFGLVGKLLFAERDPFNMVLRWLIEMRAGFRALIFGRTSRVVNIHGSIHAKSGMTLSVIRGKRDYSNLPLEDQVKGLWSEIQVLVDRLDAVDKNHRDAYARLEEMLIKAKDELAAKVAESRAHIREFLVEDFKLELLGLLMTLVGIIYGSLQEDVVSWLPR